MERIVYLLIALIISIGISLGIGLLTRKLCLKMGWGLPPDAFEIGKAYVSLILIWIIYLKWGFS